MDAHRQDNALPLVDIGIITIRDDEFQSMLEIFTESPTYYRGRREYAIRSTSAGDRQDYTVAILRQIEQGNGEAQCAARDMLDDLSPTLIIVAGIAGGLPSNDYTLGDVVVSTRIYDYSVEARASDGSATYSTSGGPIATHLAAGLANLAARGSEIGQWHSLLPTQPPITWEDDARFYGPAPWKERIKATLRDHWGHATVRHPIFIAGPIASSDRLVKDPTLLFPWIQTARNILAIEMESGGVFRAVQGRCAMVSIRGISDIVGFARDNQWTRFATCSAAAFTKAYLRTQPVPVKSRLDRENSAGRSQPASDTTGGRISIGGPRDNATMTVTVMGDVFVDRERSSGSVLSRLFGKHRKRDRRPK